ncbi:MAG TPA: hypothetical protein VN285_06320 [Candidatus Deferrimicrobium sp.]|nr:hypothetical protein [Candidatus Deferrimicrobium sp.]
MRNKSVIGLFAAMGLLILVLTAVAVGADVSPARERLRTADEGTLMSPAKIHPGDYAGWIRVYVVEPTSRWPDYYGYRYHFGLLDFAIDSPIVMSSGSRYVRSLVWDGSDNWYWDVTNNNLMIVAVLFSADPHQAYSNPPNGYPFTAYYSDAAAAAAPGTSDSNNTTGTSTHTVFVEEATATWCVYCPTVNYYLYSVYASGSYNFLYVALVDDMEAQAATRNNAFNLYGFPTTYSDGGDELLVGGWSPEGPYQSMIDACAQRAVPDVGVMAGMEWLGGDQYKINVAFAHGTPVNLTPLTPPQPSGPSSVLRSSSNSFVMGGTDPQGDQLYYRCTWKTGDTTSWLGPYGPAALCTLSHAWSVNGSYDVKVQSRDPWRSQSAWSPALSVTVFCCQNRGNVDAIVGPAGPVDVSDLTYLVAFLFSSGATPPCVDEGNVDGVIGPAGAIDVSDLTYLVAFLFSGGAAPPAC